MTQWLVLLCTGMAVAGHGWSIRRSLPRRRCSGPLGFCRMTAAVDGDEEVYSIRYSPNFHRHIVSTATSSSSGKKRVVLESFEWLDEAQRKYPTASLEPMDLPPPPLTTMHTYNESSSSHSTRQHPSDEQIQLSEIVAGAGMHETTVYYRDDTHNSSSSSTTVKANNGGAYLLRFLQKLYTTWPTLNPAEIHRAVMDKFPRIAFYDAALVHERLFFLLSPLPPPNVCNATTTSSKDTDFPLLFYRYGYGAGWTPSQLAQALQTLPQFWLPLYLSDALASSRRPQDFLPYIFYHLNSQQQQSQQQQQQQQSQQQSQQQQSQPVSTLHHPPALDTDLSLGVTAADIASWAHAQSALGMTSAQCQFLLQAFPSLRTCDVQPGWDMLLQGPVRYQLHEDAMAYLRLRLQLLDPSHIVCLFKTYTLLTHKRVAPLKKSCDYLQSALQLKSRELQQLIQRMPSLLGSSTTSLQRRIDFFLTTVGMSLEQTIQSVLILPALLQYSMDNLESTYEFFQQYVGSDDLPQVLARKPHIWGLSVETRLQPWVAAMQAYLNLTDEQVRDQVLGRAPELLLFSWNGNLKPKLQFLAQRLELHPQQQALPRLILANPRILTYSILSLEPKIRLLEEHYHNPEAATTVRDLILDNPSLLVIGHAALQKRLKHNQHTTKVGRIQRRVVQMDADNNHPINEFATVSEAAAAAGTSPSNMYSLLRQGRVFRKTNSRYAYETKDNTEEANEEDTKDAGKGGGVRHDMSRLYDVTNAPHSFDCLYASGRVCPPDNASQARGLRRVGGIAVAIPGMLSVSSTAILLQQAIDDCSQGQLLRLKKNDGALSGALLGYPLLLPSRRRCSLFACLVALRIVTRYVALLTGAITKQQRNLGQPETGSNATISTSARRPSSVPLPTHVDIVTDSTYAFGLLNDTARLLDWAMAPTQADFVYQGDEGSPSWWANKDIIWPLSRAYSRFVNFTQSTAVGSNITVNFVLQTRGEKNLVAAAAFRQQVDSWAKEAASVQYQRLSLQQESFTPK
ncbi:mitochondrial transcription termination [Seminavis robusta]|uniref:Mitochondrial transcription termination n=1 Tax=Seminavis robusta TaxID=568900 RepID=A0A9N8HIS2_9STRA|nr:mitochondrial transcription termination [Seminavis robusta]|eukprot:Sro613_g175550.1 mitochondrial transcription termination (1022) ;mRNA; r:6610-9675